ncbi:hypothetical protein A2U01_0015828, partial [Trifolium medium]|nr:hypothetical protein [Trifolium medium]
DVDSDETSDDVDAVPDSQPFAFLKDIIVTPPVEAKKVVENEVSVATFKRNLNESFNVVAQVEGKKRLRKVKIEKE